MSHRAYSSTRVRFFRPSLECLEERNLLSNSGFTGLLNGFANTIYENITLGEKLSSQVTHDTIKFEAAPHNVGALMNLELDSLELIQQAAQTQELISVFGDLLSIGEAAGLVTDNYSILGTTPIMVSSIDPAHPYGPPITSSVTNPNPKTDTQFYDDELADMQKRVSFVQSDAQAAGALMVDALQYFLFGTGTLQSLPTSTIQAAQTFTNGAVTEDITPPPAEAAASVGTVSLTATIQNGGGSTVNLLESCTGSDGGKYTLSDSCTNSTIQDTLTVPASAAGVTDTWNVAVTGQPTQTYQTVFA